MSISDSKWGELMSKLGNTKAGKIICEPTQEGLACTMAEQNDNRWKLDKHIPVAVIFTIIAQGIALVWWVSGLQHSVQDHEKRLVAQEAAKISERMAVVEVQMRDSRELQLAMDRKLDKIVDKIAEQGAK